MSNDDTFGQSWEAFCDSSDSSYERDNHRDPTPHHAVPGCHLNHESLKADDEQWLKLTYIGVLVLPGEIVDGVEYPEERLYLRNCTCGSTIARDRP